MKTKSMEMLWFGQDDDEDSSLLTGALFHAYSPPPGFCFDSLCKDVIMDDPRLEDYNWDSKILEFVNYTREQAESYATTNLIMTMGEDFNYGDANMWFKNMDKLRNYFNANHEKHGINILYSTPSCYLKALHDSKDQGWPVKTDDFMPYASDPHAYWSGYFTSRPALKGMIREANSQLQACKQVHALFGGKVGDERLETAKRAVAVNQHHDAVTGTAKQHVTDDYALRLHNGIQACDDLMMEALSQDTNGGCRLEASCHLLNISQCAFTEQFNDAMSITLYNPTATLTTSPVRLPVADCNIKYMVTDHDGRELEYQLVPVPSEVLKIPGRVSKASCELVFIASNLQPLGMTTFRVTKINAIEKKPEMKAISSEFLLSNSHVNVTFNDKGELHSIGTQDNNIIKLHQDFAFYKGAVGDNMRAENRASGAYIFRPLNQTPETIGQPQSTSVIRGSTEMFIFKYSFIPSRTNC